MAVLAGAEEEGGIGFGAGGGGAQQDLSGQIVGRAGAEEAGFRLDTVDRFIVDG
ncbi:MAG: hypothetical protein JWN14_1612, partial [Chthonomonadales bacterium]|nr:hypothetical protein [Chthonomonadales bacterium]